MNKKRVVVVAVCSLIMVIASCSCGENGNGAGDVIPPVTTADPTGDTFPAPVDVALTANETAVVYYTTDGSTPSISSPCGPSPQTVSIDTIGTTTLKFFGIDTAGNQEIVRTEIYEITSDDIDPPVITSGPDVVLVTAAAATIEWTTDEISDSVVDYGLTVTYDQTESDPNDVTDHSITLTGLTAETTYHFRVSSTDPFDNGPTYSGDLTFTTTGVDTTPPVITSGPTVTGLTDTTATVIWTTDEISDSVVDYGLTVTYDQTESDPNDVTDHSITLTGLTAETTYHFRVSSTDPFDNGPTNSGDLAFTTPGGGDITPPVITSGPTVTGLIDTKATVIWTTNEISDSVVEYGLDTSYGNTESDATDVTEHSITLTGLTKETEYHFRVGSTDPFDNGPTYSADLTFTTPSGGDITPPVITSGPTMVDVTDSTATIEWQTDEVSDSVVQYGLDTSYGNTESDPTDVTSHSITLTGLTAETTYHFRVGSTDPYDNGPVWSADLTFVTDVDATPPVITSGPTATGVSETTAAIEWQTDEISDSVVDYGLTAAYGDTESDPTDVTDHSITLTGLTAATEYHFRVSSTDPLDNGPTSSDDFTFTTTSPPPVADFEADKTIGGAPLTVQFTDKSSGGITDWDWTFGDGGASADQDPTHIYITEGSFTVSLTVTGAGGSDTETKTDYIHTVEGIYVPDEYSTIQAAIDAAGSGDMVLVADGTYAGSGNKNLDFKGKAITVRSLNGPGDCIIDCENDGRGFKFRNDEGNNSVVMGFTIKNGKAKTVDTYSPNGSGIYCDEASPTITGNIITDNVAGTGGSTFGYGGGIYCEQCSPIITHNIIMDNSTDASFAYGGGIYCDRAHPAITNNLIIGNSASGGSKGIGGGIYCGECSPIIINNTIVANSAAQEGGGLYCIGAPDICAPSIINCIFWGNSAPDGHEIFVRESVSEIPNPSISYCDIQDKDGSGVDDSGNGIIWGAGVISSDPKFVSSSDYHLQDSSLCKDAGDDSAVDWDKDLDGNARKVGTVDMGAYEKQ